MGQNLPWKWFKKLGVDNSTPMCYNKLNKGKVGKRND